MPELLGDLQYDVDVTLQRANQRLADFDKTMERYRQRWERPINIGGSGIGSGGNGSGGTSTSGTGRTGDTEREVNDAFRARAEATRRAARSESDGALAVYDANQALASAIRLRASAISSGQRSGRSGYVDENGFAGGGNGQPRLSGRYNVDTENIAGANRRAVNTDYDFEGEVVGSRRTLALPAPPGAEGGGDGGGGPPDGGRGGPPGRFNPDFDDPVRPDNPPAGNGRRGGFRAGGLARYATIGFALRETLNAAQQFQDYSNQVSLSGDDPRTITESTLAARKSMFSIPLVGQVFGLAQGGEDAGIQRILNAATAEDDANGPTAAFAELSLNARRKGAAASARDQFERERIQAQNSLDSEDMTAVAARNAETVAKRKQLELVADSNLSDRDPRVLANLKWGTIDDLPIRMADARASVIRSIVDPQMHDLAIKANQRLTVDQAADAAVYRYNKGVADRAESAVNIASVTATAVDQYKLSNPIYSSLLDSAGSTAAKLAGSEEGDKPRIRQEGASDFMAKFSDAAHGTLEAFDGLRISALSVSSALAHDPRQAAYVGIEAEREEAYRNPIAQLPIIGSLFTTSADYVARRKRGLVDQQFDEQSSLIDIAQSTHAGQTDALLRRDKIGAEALGIVAAGKTEADQLKFGGRPLYEQQNALKNSIGDLNLLKFNYLDAFRGTQVDLRLMDTQNPRDSQDPTKILGEISQGVTNLTNVLSQLTSQ